MSTRPAKLLQRLLAAFLSAACLTVASVAEAKLTPFLPPSAVPSAVCSLPDAAADLPGNMAAETETLLLEDADGNLWLAVYVGKNPYNGADVYALSPTGLAVTYDSDADLEKRAKANRWTKDTLEWWKSQRDQVKKLLDISSSTEYSKMSDYDKIIHLLYASKSFNIKFEFGNAGAYGLFDKNAQGPDQHIIHIEYPNRKESNYQGALKDDLLGEVISHEIGHFYRYLILEADIKPGGKRPDIWVDNKTYDKYWTNWYYDECRYGHSWFTMKESKDKQMIKATSQLSTRYGDRSDYTPVTGADFKSCLGFDYPVIDSNPFVSSVSTAFLKTGSLTEADYIGWKLWTSGRPANKKISESTDKWSRECKETYERRIRNPQQW